MAKTLSILKNQHDYTGAKNVTLGSGSSPKHLDQRACKIEKDASSAWPAAYSIATKYLLFRARDTTLASVMAEIFVVGSASGFPAPGRGHSSLLLSWSEKSILIDAGEPCSRSLAEAGISFSTIEAAL